MFNQKSESPILFIEETLSLSFERKDSSDSMNDSSDLDEYCEIRLNIQEAENNQKYQKMRRLMSKFTIAHLEQAAPESIGMPWDEVPSLVR